MTKSDRRYEIERSNSGYRVAVRRPAGQFIEWLGGPEFLSSKEEAEARIRAALPSADDESPDRN
jgi:hypothetical protein